MVILSDLVILRHCLKVDNIITSQRPEDFQTKFGFKRWFEVMPSITKDFFISHGGKALGFSATLKLHWFTGGGGGGYIFAIHGSGVLESKIWRKDGRSTPINLKIWRKPWCNYGGQHFWNVRYLGTPFLLEHFPGKPLRKSRDKTRGFYLKVKLNLNFQLGRHGLAFARPGCRLSCGLIDVVGFPRGLVILNCKISLLLSLDCVDVDLNEYIL